MLIFIYFFVKPVSQSVVQIDTLLCKKHTQKADKPMTPGTCASGVTHHIIMVS